MAAVIEISYFNSFWLKQVRNDNAVPTPVWPNGYPYNRSAPEGIGPIVDKTGAALTPFPGSAFAGEYNWFVEESRIRGGYNNTQVDLGVKAYIVEDESQQQHRSSALIYSGIFNSRTGINNTNQFSVGESITKATDPANGSIQKLYAEDTNLIVFQENKVSRALIDKDAIYSAEGNAAITSTQLVIGQIVPYAGNYGISKNPESFAVYGYQKYFTDKDRNAVLRLSMDGLTEISSYGMLDYFRDYMSNIGESGRMIGGYDIHNKNYTLSLQTTPAWQGNPDTASTYATLTFDELVNGWNSFFTYKPTFITSLKNKFYSFKNGAIYEHYSNPGGSNRGTFYGSYAPSNITFVFNDNSNVSKNFQTVNYEGDNGWQVNSFVSDAQRFDYVNGGWVSYDDTTAQVPSYNKTYNDGGVIYRLGFDRKENKYFANLINNSTARDGEVVWGNEMSGIKGYFATVTFSTDGSTAKVLSNITSSLTIPIKDLLGTLNIGDIISGVGILGSPKIVSITQSLITVDVAQTLTTNTILSIGGTDVGGAKELWSVGSNFVVSSY